VSGGANDGQVKPVGLTREARFSDQFEVLERIHAN